MTQNKPNCCDYCLGIKAAHGSKGSEITVCENTDCTCHTTKAATTWEEEFNEYWYNGLKTQTKELIRNVEARAREETKTKTLLEVFDITHAHAIRTTSTKALDSIERLQKDILALRYNQTDI